jgi:N-methylhydantoinase B
VTVNVQIDRVHCRPWGLAGGHEGMGNRVALRLKGKEVGDLPNAKVLAQRLMAGEAITLSAGGGGGFGPPQERDPARVAHDVRQGYVSAAVARDVYRVALKPDGEVDAEATRRLRGG